MIQCEHDLLANLIVLTSKNARREFRQQIFKDWDWKCAYCDSQLNERNATIDHITPKFKGGHSTRSNMCCCCSLCNREKASSLLEDWYIEGNVNYCEKRLDRLKAWIEQSYCSIEILPTTNDRSIGWVPS